MPFKNRSIGKEELHIVHDLAHQIWPDTFKEILVPAQIEYMLDMMYSIESLNKQHASGHQFIVWEDANQPVAYVGIERNFPQDGTLRIHKIYILPEKQGEGLGKSMIATVKQLAISEGFLSLNLNVNRFNKAVDFYTHLGFKTIKTEDIDIGNGYLMEDYVMEWKF